MTQAPRRLRDDPASPELARALREAQGDVLSPEALARVGAGLTAAGIAAAAGAGAGMGAGLSSPAAKLLALAARLGVGLAGLGIVGAGVVGVASMRHASGGAAVVAPDQAVPTTSPAPADQAAAPESPTFDAPAATSAAPVVARPSARPPAAMPSPREGALLLEARRALAADPARALALVHAHETEFPQSQLGPERARIAAEARRRMEK
jgi:hypothetical protein